MCSDRDAFHAIPLSHEQLALHRWRGYYGRLPSVSVGYLTIFCGVLRVAEDDVDEIVRHLRLVVRDLEQDRRDRLVDERDVNVWRLA